MQYQTFTGHSQPVPVVADEGGNPVKLPGLVRPFLRVPIGQEEGGWPVGNPAHKHPLLGGPVAGEVDRGTQKWLEKNLNNQFTKSSKRIESTSNRSKEMIRQKWAERWSDLKHLENSQDWYERVVQL